MSLKREKYRRRDLHELYRGQDQGDISTPADYPVIMIFTGEQGHQFGYRDEWIWGATNFQI